MASVSSLDKDLRNMRLSRYTPQASKEVRDWIEDVLGEKLAPGDLLEALKDGVALCKLVNLATSPGVKYKQSNMPFVQMENISHFLRAIQAPPLSLPPHDVFLTVDLYEAKDPAQVLQCIGAFSRVANVAQPSRFPKPIGPKSAGPRAGMSPQTTGASNGRSRGISNASQGSFGGRPISPTRSDVAASPVRPGSGLNSPKGPVSSWSKKTDEFNTAPAWNIHQYGYMGGASQGNQGIAFGARRQITSPAPAVPSIAEKERKRKEEEVEKERLRVQAEEAEQRRRVEREAEEERARAEEERRWQEETRRQREQEKKALEEEKRRWEEEERLWREEEEKREREEKEAQLRMKNAPPSQSRGGDARLNGQFLSTYQSSQGRISRDTSAEDLERQAERDRIRELERQLQQAKERESRYQQERQGRSPSISQDENTSPPPAIIPTQAPSAGVRTIPDPPTNDAAWEEDERAYLQREWATHNTSPPTARPLPSRPLPDPTTYKPPTATHVSRTDRFLADNPAPAAAAPRSHFPSELGLTSSSERDAEDSRRVASQTKTRAGGWASSSLLEREMERERERQREWEADQERLKSTGGTRIDGEGVGPGESWDVNQYGYMGGDSQNRGSRGVNFGGRRQIIGPRPPK